MSILDGLALYDADGHEVPRSHKEMGCYFLSREVGRALTNPTDEQVKHLTDHAITAFAQGIRWGDGSADDLLSGVVRAVLAAAAGGDQ